MTALQKAESIRARKTGPPIAALTAYDYPSARLLDESGIDVLLVGDSLGMVVLGFPDTTHVTDRKSTRLNSSHRNTSRMPSSA